MQQPGHETATTVNLTTISLITKTQDNYFLKNVDVKKQQILFGNVS